MNALRLPPNSPESEQGILGCIMLEPGKCLDHCADIQLPPEAFYDLRHRMIFTLAVEMHAALEPVDVITLQSRLKSRGELEQIGGLQYLAALPDCTPSAANLDFYIETVMEAYTKRRIISTCTELVGRAYDHAGTAQELVETAEQQIMAIRTREAVKMPTIKQIVAQVIGEIEENHQRQGAIPGIATGIKPLDAATGGLHDGEMTVIAAFPSVGKTALAMNIAANVCMVELKSVGVFSLEMTSTSLIKRMMCSESRVNIRRINAGDMQGGDFPKLTAAARKISHSCIYLDDTSDLSIYQLRARARKMVKDFGIKLFVIDYLQLMNATGGPRKMQNREQEVADISSGVKNMAKEFRLPVIVLSQLNDDGQIRESRRIAQDADNILKLHRDDKAPNSENGEGINLVIEKQRNGPRGIVIPLTFLKQFTRFEARATGPDQSDIPTHHND